jgi:hypothetical protein
MDEVPQRHWGEDVGTVYDAMKGQLGIPAVALRKRGLILDPQINVLGPLNSSC